MHLKKHFIFTLILIVITVCQVSAQEPEKIPFSLTRFGHIFIRTNITDDLNAGFIFDTGSGIHVLAEKHKKNMDIESVGYLTVFRHTGERLDFELFQTTSIKLGSLIEKEPYIVFWNLLDESGIDGLYSLKIIENQPVTMDFINNNIIIETEESMKTLLKTGKVIPIELQMKRDKSLDIHAYFKINDKITVEFEIDTGSGNKIIMDKRFLEILGMDSSGSETEEIIQKEVQKIALLDAPEISLENHIVDFKKRIIYDGIIGISIWKNRKLTIDIPNKRIIVNNK